MTALGKNICLRVYKVFGSQDTDVLHGSYPVGIVEDGVDNGNRHALSLETFPM